MTLPCLLFTNNIKKIDDNYICDIESINDGIIILKDNLKLLGIKKEKKIITMNIIVNKINFIKCIYDIKKEDIFKDIQIINNSFYLEDFSDL